MLRSFVSKSLRHTCLVFVGAVFALPITVEAANYRDVKFGRAVELTSPVNGSGGTGIGFSEYPQDAHPTLTRDGLVLVWQSKLVKNPNWINDPDNTWYIVQSNRSALSQAWSSPVEIIASGTGDDPRFDRTPSLSRDGLRLLFNDDSGAAGAVSGREQLRIASRLDRLAPFEHSEIVDLVDRRFQDVLDQYTTTAYFDQYRCSFTYGASHQRWTVYPENGFLGRCGNMIYFMASDIFATPDWEFVFGTPPPWPVPGYFNRHAVGAAIEGYLFRLEPLTFKAGPLNGQDCWAATSGVSIVNRSPSACEANQFIEFAAGQGDLVAERNTDNTGTGSGQPFVTRFGISGLNAASSAVIELGFDDGQAQHVFARLDLNRSISDEFAAVNGNLSGGGTSTPIVLTDVNTGGGNCVPVSISYEPLRWYLVEITATMSSTSPVYEVIIRDPQRFGPVVYGQCNYPEKGHFRLGSVAGQVAIDGLAASGPLNYVRIIGSGIRLDAGPLCSVAKNLSMYPFAGLLQAEAMIQPADLQTLPLYGEIRSLRIKNYNSAASPSQAGPTRTNNPIASPYVADDNLVVYYSSSGYWNNGQYTPPDEGCPGGTQCPGVDCCEEDGYYGFPQPVLWRGERVAVRDQQNPIQQAVRLKKDDPDPLDNKLQYADPITCPGIMVLASASRQLTDPHVGPDGLYFTTINLLAGDGQGQMAIWRAGFFGDLDGDGDVDSADAGDFAMRMSGPYDAAIDYDLDGTIDVDDQAAFDHNLGFQAGDFDGDNDVDHDDFEIMLAACGATLCDATWNQGVDLDRNLMIDTGDLDRFRVEYGLGVPGGASSLPVLPGELVCPLNCNDPVFDINNDGYVDLETDFGDPVFGFVSCASGPSPTTASFSALSPECRCLDVNGDAAIDMKDFAVFQACLTVNAVTVDAACDD